MNLRAVLLSLAVGTLTVALLVLYLRRLENETAGGVPVAVVAAIRPLEPGTILTQEMLSVKVVPQAYIESRAVLKSDLTKIIGLKVDIAVKAQQTLMWTDLAITSDDRRQLSLLVQPGMRAVGIRATEDDRHFALIRPGDRVDVYANVHSANSNNDKDRVSVAVVQNVMVLAVGLDTSAREVSGAGSQSGNREDKVLTLSVTPQQLQLLALAGERGKLTVGVRNPADTRVVDGIAELSSSILTAPARTSTPDKEKEKGRVTGGGPTKPVQLTSNMGPSTAPVPRFD